MDSTDVQIIKLLSTDCRMSYNRIASQLDISEPTVRSRVRKLLDNKVISFQTVLNPDALPDLLIAYVGIQHVGDPFKWLEYLTKIPEVIYAVNTIGRYDIIAVVAVNRRERLSEILTQEIVGAKTEKANLHLSATETHVVLNISNLQLPAENIIEIL